MVPRMRCPSAMPVGSKVGVRGAGVGVLQKDLSGPKRQR